mmetsp:Transcript_13868/g.45867  ORF Transcript_13868/g.45867 Transcript_13868/m.45867 type:complete len:217 (-) Transcript_13868:903-1553(-)
MKSAFTVFPPNFRPCSASLAAAAPETVSYRTNAFPKPGTFLFPSPAGRGIATSTTAPNFPHSSRTSSSMSANSWSSRSSSISNMSDRNTTCDGGLDGGAGDGVTETAGGGGGGGRFWGGAPSPPGTAYPYPAGACGAAVPCDAAPLLSPALFTVSVFSPIFMPCKPWHATSVTLGSWYTKKPYPLLLPVSGSITNLNDFVTPNASTNSLTIWSVRK